MSQDNYPCKIDSPRYCGWGRIDRSSTSIAYECTYPRCHYGQTVTRLLGSEESEKNNNENSGIFEATVFYSNQPMADIFAQLLHQQLIEAKDKGTWFDSKTSAECRPFKIVDIQLLRLSLQEYKINIVGEFV